MKGIQAFLLIVAVIGACTASHYHTPRTYVINRYVEQAPIEHSTIYHTYGTYNPNAYQFSYRTGGSQLDDAQHFREESRDESGYVVGKYGYVDPYGKLRVVNYRAGPDGYHVTGDIGPDEEAIRQQRLLYAGDESVKVQQQAWRSSNDRSSSSSSSASSSSSSSSSAASNGGIEWTSVPVESVAPTSADYIVKGRNQFAERYTAVRSPAAKLRETSTTESVNTINTSKTIGSSSSSSAASSSSSSSSSGASYPAHTTITTHTKSVPRVAEIKQYSYSYQIPSKTIQVLQPARIVQSEKTIVQRPVATTTTTYLQSPAARLVSINNGASASVSASASASASAAASSSSNTDSSHSHTSGVKGVIYSTKSAPIRIAPIRYVRSGSGHTVVNFQQGGPVPYKYSYAY